MTYVVKRIDEQMYGCEEPAPGAEVLVDVTLVAPDGVKRVLPYPDAALAAADINEGDTADCGKITREAALRCSTDKKDLEQYF